MNRPKVSIIMPSIRPENWVKIYDSIKESCKKYTWELVICGPYHNKDIKDSWQSYGNLKFFFDLGSPVRASQIAGAIAEGELITWTSDDALYLPGALDRMIDLWVEKQSNLTVVLAKYYEGMNGTYKPLQPDAYWRINGSPWTKSPYIPDDWWIFNQALISMSMFESFGGWNCDYQVTAIANTDLAIRMQLGGMQTIMSDMPLLDCDHNQPDHKPIEDAQINEDLPLLWKRYREVDFKLSNNLRIHIDYNNWKKCKRVWEKRWKLVENKS